MKYLAMITDSKLKTWALVITTVLLTYQFGEFLIGEKGFIATTAQIRTLEKNAFKQAIELKEINLKILNKEIDYQKRKCGYNPLEGNCLSKDEKIYYSKLVEEKELLQEIIAKVDKEK